MKRKTNSGVYASLIIALVIFLTCSCKKPAATPDTNLPSDALPSITTKAASSITPYTAVSGGNITSDGGSAVTTRGVCWSTSQSFTIDNCLNKTTDGADVGSFSSLATELNYNTTYYIRAYGTNSNGTGYGNLVSFKTTTPAYIIGQSYGGGIIFYIDGTGQHGLISATTDQSTGAPWGCSGTLIGTGMTLSLMVTMIGFYHRKMNLIRCTFKI